MGAEICALLHSDGQYAPEVLPQLLEPLELAEADVVMGSRMLDPVRARGVGCRYTNCWLIEA